jgi:hypothetical protein
MSIHIRAVPILFAVLTIGSASGVSMAQSTGPAALAAKQDIKTRVQSAAADGKISEDERHKILSNAKDILSAKEYFGLVETMNRLSPPDRATPESLGRAPYIDKQTMANFPTPDLSWLEKSPVSKIIPKHSLAFNKQTPSKPQYVVRETIIKETIVKEGIPQRSIAKTITTKTTITQPTASKKSIAQAATSKKSIVKPTDSKQSIAKANVPKQNLVVKRNNAKTIEPNVTSKVELLSPPPQRDNIKQAQLTVTSKARVNVPESIERAAPLPPAKQPQARNSQADKTTSQQMTAQPKSRTAINDEAVLQQPEKMWGTAERSAISHSYNDYSVPVLAASEEALISDASDSGDENITIQASYEQTLDPESNPGIVGR